MHLLLRTLVIFLLLSSCVYRNQIERKSEVVIIDTVSINNSFITEKWQERENYIINYIGEKKDSVLINHFAYPLPPPPPEFSYDTTIFSLSKKANELFNKQVEKYICDIDNASNISSIYFDSIIIYIDTTQIIGKDSYPAYPVIIENKYFDTLRVCYAYDRRIYAILEAKDSIGHWKSLNEENYPHGLPINKEIILLKDHIITTSVYVYFGDFNTELRLKIGNNYSNVISGWINYNQFNSKFDDRGNYKEEYLKERNQNAR